jgi:hypothetical protein
MYYVGSQLCHGANSTQRLPGRCFSGPPSSVQLTTTYLDERIRLGKGSRGSLFVFTRGGAADEAGELMRVCTHV